MPPARCFRRSTRRRRAPTPESAHRTLWRVFPWSESAKRSDPFAPDYLPPQSGQGRFDLPAESGASAWYFAETPEHAIAEKIQDLRNRALSDEFLIENGHRLALCAIRIASVRIADLCDPGELLDRTLTPDRLACQDRTVTRAIAHQLHQDPNLSGFRWWSALKGEWHTTILFSDRLSHSAMTFAAPAHLTLDHPDLLTAASALAIDINGRSSGKRVGQAAIGE